ncbi:hypothetical protein GYMLUDRAFT_50048 [Collybiopsis luxurians FD-317 M1]|uniref:Uncharacterized protein n=1 Tax=Collybiopsis luxurians FD-317 M1 TaxID=944289 RepID=A0A0D0APH7_9AGAR|nr:hypothetical protein GYMLUDRAFT_50048 [Collybiopsis luxurians FD-317 M1]
MTSVAGDFDSSNEIEDYVRLLLTQKKGYPLWNPRPGDWLPPAYREAGVRIGDVGIVTEFGEFDYLFNVCLPPDDPVNAGRVPENFKHIEGIDVCDISWFTQEYGPGAYVASKASPFNRARLEDVRIPGVPEEIVTGTSLRSSTTRGALLILPEGGKSVNYPHLSKFYQLAAECAHSWYDFVNGPLARGVRNNSIYLVTGCDKARAWGVASFTDAPADSVSLDFVPRLTHNGAREYWFRNCDFAASSSGTSHDTNPAGCVFLRGFKVAVRSPQFTRTQSNFQVTYISKLEADELPPTRMENTPTMMWQWLSHYMGLTVFSRMFSERRVSISASEDNDEYDFTKYQIYHPSDVINKCILNKYEEVDIAITHDNEWAFVIETVSYCYFIGRLLTGFIGQGDVNMPEDEELFHRMHEFLKFSKSGQHTFTYFELPPQPNHSGEGERAVEQRNNFSTDSEGTSAP